MSHHCRECDNKYRETDWDSDADMCVYCALVNIIEEDK
jgi:hypothetical protein